MRRVRRDGRGAKMIRFILLQNVLGKTRLAKYYVPYEDSEKRKIEYDINKIVAGRDRKFANVVEVRFLREEGTLLLSSES